jgi:hypothetical protein
MVIRELVADSPRLYREAHRLYITARLDMERFDVDYDQIVGSMREEAARSLQREKDSGVRSKAITEADVTARVSDLFPDEVLTASERKLQTRKTVEHLKHLVEVFKARGFALLALAGSKENL